MPPNLNSNHHKSSRLPTLFPVALLNALPGAAGLVETDGTCVGLSRHWDRVMSRAKRPQWTRDVVAGKSVYDLLDNEKQKSSLQKVIASLVNGQREEATELLSAGTGAQAVHIEMILHPLELNGSVAGILIQLFDVTRDHLNRLAILDRDRKLKELQERTGSQEAEQSEAMAKAAEESRAEIEHLKIECERLAAENQQLMEAQQRAEETKPDNSWMVITEAVEEYGNLLTGVLGHATLAAAEIGEGHAATEDIRAIERAARTAAILTRKIAGVCARPTPEKTTSQ